MTNDQIIRAWKDENYRSSLSEQERSELPAHPAGLIELTASELNAVSGGNGGHATIVCTKETISFCGTTFFTKCY